MVGFAVSSHKIVDISLDSGAMPRWGGSRARPSGPQGLVALSGRMDRENGRGVGVCVWG